MRVRKVRRALPAGQLHAAAVAVCSQSYRFCQSDSVARVQRLLLYTTTSTASPSPSSTSTTGTTSSPSPGASVSSTVSPSTAAFPTVTPKVTTVAVRDPASAGVLRYALPLLLLIGGLAALGGAASLVAPNSAAIAARLRRLSSAGRPFRRKP